VKCAGACAAHEQQNKTAGKNYKGAAPRKVSFKEGQIKGYPS